MCEHVCAHVAQDLGEDVSEEDADPEKPDIGQEKDKKKIKRMNSKGKSELKTLKKYSSKKMAADLLKEGDYVPFYRVDKNGKADLVFNNNVTFNVGDIRRQP
jgi:hypothetical protein